MSKFIKTKSIRLKNQTGSNINRISKQYNKEVIELNETYKSNNNISNNKDLVTSIIHDKTNNDISDITDSECNTFFIDDIYNTQVKVQGLNPIHNVVNKETINYGNKLDYLYKKQQLKKNKSIGIL